MSSIRIYKIKNIFKQEPNLLAIHLSDIDLLEC